MGCKRTPKSFDLSEIRAKSLKIRAKMAKICRQKSHNTFQASLGEIQAKILRTPKNLLPPAPVISWLGPWTVDFAV